MWSGCAPSASTPTRWAKVGALSRTAFVWYIQRATLVVIVSLGIFVAVPTQTVRPLLDPANEQKLGDDLTGKLYRQMVAIDVKHQKDRVVLAEVKADLSAGRALLCWQIGVKADINVTAGAVTDRPA